MTGLQAELEAAFRKLPIAPPDDGRIPYEWVIPGIGRQLALMKPVDCKVASPDAAKRKLGALKKHAKTRAQGSRCDGTRPQPNLIHTAHLAMSLEYKGLLIGIFR